MNILLAGVEQVQRDERYMDDKGWSFRKAFEKLGATVHTFYYKKKGALSVLEKNKYIKDVWHSYMNMRLVESVSNLQPDILIILKGETITEDTLWSIRKKGNTLIANVFPDNPLYMGKFEAIKPCHYFFVKDSYILMTLRKAGLKNVLYLPQCTDPDVHRPVELTDEEKSLYYTDLSMIGSMYPYRLKFMEDLIDMQPAIWGRGWSRTSNSEIASLYRGRDVRGSEKAKVISATAISLNPHHPLNDIHGVNRRTFDIAACGGFQLADHKADMDRVFRVNQEIICFKTVRELRQLADHYLRNPDERKEIAQAAYKRVTREHTYDNRAREIFEIVTSGSKA